MTTITFDHGGTTQRIEPPPATAGHVATVAAVAGRSVRKFLRTPQLLVISVITGAMFLLIFRYVFGGAIETGPVPYVDFLVPGYIVTSVLFTGSNVSSGVAEDLEQGFTDRLRSLPVSRLALMSGRVVAETGCWRSAWRSRRPSASRSGSDCTGRRSRPSQRSGCAWRSASP